MNELYSSRGRAQIIAMMVSSSSSFLMSYPVAGQSMVTFCMAPSVHADSDERDSSS